MDLDIDKSQIKRLEEEIYGERMGLCNGPSWGRTFVIFLPPVFVDNRSSDSLKFSGDVYYNDERHLQGSGDFWIVSVPVSPTMVPRGTLNA